MGSENQGRGATGRIAGRGTQASNRDMAIRDVMSEDVVTAMPGDTVFAAVQRMSESKVSCLVVIDGERIVGILTERDVLRAIAGPQVDLQRITVVRMMSSPVQSVSPALSVLAAGRIMEARQIRRLPVLEGRRLVGIVTQTDVTRGLITLIPLRSISDIMTREVASITEDAMVAEAARVMASRRISCVVIMRQGKPVGILTEKDMIRRVVTAQRNPCETHATDVMSSPVMTIPPDYSVLGVSRKMDALHLHRLIVMEGGEQCGIVTQTDIMRAVRAELERVETEHWGWMMELATQVQATRSDFQKLEHLVQKLNGSCAALGDLPHGEKTPTGDHMESTGETPAESKAAV